MAWLLQLDNQMLAAIGQLHCGFLDIVMPLVTALGDYGLLWIAAGLLLSFTSKYRRHGILLLGTLLLATLLGEGLLKHLVERERPFAAAGITELLISTPHGYSFPSGHTMSSFAAATVLLYTKKSWGAAGYCAAGLIGFSRLYLGVHYPSDVLAGALLGIILATSVMQFYRYLRKKQRRRNKQ